MTSQPTHISAILPAAVAALQGAESLEQLCAAVDRENPLALEHWTCRIYLMRKFPDADEAIRSLLAELASRRTSRQAKSKSYTDLIARPGAWLNAMTLQWLQRRPTAAKPQPNR